MQMLPIRGRLSYEYPFGFQFRVFSFSVGETGQSRAVGEWGGGQNTY